MKAESNKIINQLAVQMFAGDPDATVRLMKSITPVLTAILLSQRIPSSQIEDLIQEAFLSIWKRGNKSVYDPTKSNFVSWIAQNAIWINKSNGRKAQCMFEYFDTESHRFNIKEEKFNNFDKELLLEIIEALPSDEKDLINLCAGRGISFNEVGIAQGVPYRTVQSRYHRTRVNVKEEYLERVAV